MATAYRDTRIRRNRQVVEQHPNWRHVRPERLYLPPKQADRSPGVRPRGR